MGNPHANGHFSHASGKKAQGEMYKDKSHLSRLNSCVAIYLYARQSYCSSCKLVCILVAWVKLNLIPNIIKIIHFDSLKDSCIQRQINIKHFEEMQCISEEDL